MENDDLEFVNNSDYRIKVIKTFGGDAKMPIEIAYDSGISQNQTSNVLRQLRQKEIVECINPEVRKGRLYRLSDAGLIILNNLE